MRQDPTALLESPNLKRALPDVLSFDEIEKIIAQIDHSKPEGDRNQAILETMYSCGLRVSEVVNLRISCLYLDVGHIRVIGKGDKERSSPSAPTQSNTSAFTAREPAPISPSNRGMKTSSSSIVAAAALAGS